MDSDPIYEALSYTWGELVPSTTLSCCSRKLAITQNLSEVLRRLRDPTRDRVWCSLLVC